MTTETVTMPASLLERILSFFGQKPEPAAPEPEAPPPAPGPEPAVLSAAVSVDQLTALQNERDDLAARIATMQAEREQAARVAQYAAEFDGTALAGDAELPALLAGLPDAAAGDLTRRLKALAEQGRVAALTADVGHEGQAVTGDPVAALDAAIRAKMTSDKVDYNAALNAVRGEQPALVAAVYGGK